MEQVETIVVGAGVVGLAVARELALAGQEVFVLERCDAIGTETSSRNSEVVHAGIYYPEDWLKTKLCIEGRRRLYAYCDERGVPCRKLGKVIVACSDDEVAVLDRTLAQANRNGVELMERLDKRQLGDMEPEVSATAGLFSPETGVVDSHQLMLSLQGDLENAGGMVSLKSPFRGAESTGSGFAVTIGGDDDYVLGCRNLINSAGLAACDVAQAIEPLSSRHVPRQWLARGQYYGLQGRSPFNHLVYPVPVAGGLGVHVTMDLAGQVRFGPDVHWIDGIDYGFDESVIEQVAEGIRRYFPDLDRTALQPAYTGIRPKLSGPSAPGADFQIDGPQVHGVQGLVNLFGIESPGLTACLTLAGHVRMLLN